MSLSISQILASSFEAVVKNSRGPENTWADNSFLNALESKGFIEKINLGPTIEVPIDWRRNTGAGFITTELEPYSMAATDVLTAASYTPAELGAPINWSKRTEATNPTENQKINIVKALIENGMTSHDDVLEEAMFTTTTAGFNGLQTLVPDSGQGTVGGIDASTETMWRNTVTSYTGATDIEASMTTNWNAVLKGSGSGQAPTLVISGSVPYAQFESTQQTLQRWNDGTKTANVGFKNLQFKNADYVFSQYGGTRIYMLNPKSISLKVSKSHFRSRSETVEMQGMHGFTTNLYTALQFVVINKNRCGLVKI